MNLVEWLSSKKNVGNALLSYKSVSPMPGAEPYEQQAQIGVVLALGFFLLRFLLLGGFLGFSLFG